MWLPKWIQMKSQYVRYMSRFAVDVVNAHSICLMTTRIQIGSVSFRRWIYKKINEIIIRTKIPIVDWVDVIGKTQLLRRILLFFRRTCALMKIDCFALEEVLIKQTVSLRLQSKAELNSSWRERIAKFTFLFLEWTRSDYDFFFFSFQVSDDMW